MKKIIFVNAPMASKEIYGDLAEAGNEQPPLGLATLAAITRENKYETEILDCKVLNINYTQALKIILEKNPDYIGFTSMTVYIQNVAKLADMIKENNKHIKIIVGGPHISALPEETMEKFHSFDIGVLGEGDITIIELLKALDSNENLSEINGLIYRENNKLIKTKPREFIKDLDILPIPAYDLLPDIRKYYAPPANSLCKSPSISIVSSRGCPNNCSFCANIIFHKSCRAHSAEYVIKLIKHLHYDYGIREIQFYEDNFMAYRTRLIKICNMLIEEKLDLSWWCMGSINFVNKEVLELMKKAGCWQIAYGCESGSQKMLDNYKKNITPKQIYQAVKWTKEAGISTTGFFILGGPGETKETMKETMNFVKKLPLDEFQLTYFSPLPGSEIFNNVRKYGTFDDDLKKMSLFIPSFIPDGLTKEDLIYSYKKIYKEFYLRPRIIFYFFKKFLKSKGLRIKMIKSFYGYLKLIKKKNIYE